MRNRTADLYNAIVALYQLSYDPEIRVRPRRKRQRREPETTETTDRAQGKNKRPAPG
ncbi:MAG: hypothetical protein JWO51_4939 [Rhodospirillales bacterium]|jgi:hypothetical protein|nr:hypothetical protein [Rhodospirillales bacterium]